MHHFPAACRRYLPGAGLLLATTGSQAAAQVPDWTPVPARVVGLVLPPSALPELRARHGPVPQVFINRLFVPDYLLIPNSGINLTKEQVLASLPHNKIKRVTWLSEDAFFLRYRRPLHTSSALFIEVRAPQMVKALRHYHQYGPY
jgi:hypothetical protein